MSSLVLRAAKMLGWTSLAVGATEIAATKWLEEQLGVKDQETLIRGFGVREIAAGAKILTQFDIGRKLANAVWARVVGDALDLAALGLAKPRSHNRDGWRTITTIVLAITGLDILVGAAIEGEMIKTRQIARRNRWRGATNAREHVTETTRTRAATRPAQQQIG